MKIATEELMRGKENNANFVKRARGENIDVENLINDVTTL